MCPRHDDSRFYADRLDDHDLSDPGDHNPEYVTCDDVGNRSGDDCRQ
jgi:hypothetical protein